MAQIESFGHDARVELDRDPAQIEPNVGGIDLRTPLSLGAAFRFPLQHAQARRELLWGAALLLVPGIGWLLNMGHRIEMVHRMQQGLPPWPAFTDYRRLLRHGLITLFGMVVYHLPATAVAAIAYTQDIAALFGLAALLWIAATMVVPGYMTHYCVAFDVREVFAVGRAFARVREGGPAYLHAWCIALSALCLSFAGLLVFGVGFLVTSVWFWQVAGFSFATVFTHRYALARPQMRL